MTSKIGGANQVEPGSTSLEVQKAKAERVEKAKDDMKLAISIPLMALNFNNEDKHP